MLLDPIPNILGTSREEVIHYHQDLKHFYYLAPNYGQQTNIFFMESTISTKDNIFDIYELSKKEVSLFEQSFTQKLAKWIPPTTAVADREYLNIYFRSATEAHLYKREEYNLLTFFGDLGGLLEFLSMFGWALSTVFASRLFAAALVT